MKRSRGIAVRNGLSISQPAGDYNDAGEELWTANIHGTTGAAHNVSDRADFAEQENRVQKFRETVAEVTNGRIPAPTRRGPGFY